MPSLFRPLRPVKSHLHHKPPMDHNNLTRFTIFNEFPYEIRLMVWEAAIEPRIVHLKVCHVSECKHMLRRVRSDAIVPDRCGGKTPENYKGIVCAGHTHDAYQEPVEELHPRYKGHDLDYAIEDLRDIGHQSGIKTDAPFPAILLACHESFEIASRFYTQSFSSQGTLAQTYFDFKHDTLYLDLNSFPWHDDDVMSALVPRFCQGDLSKVKNLAIHYDIFAEGSTAQLLTYVCQILDAFGNVEKFTVVLTDDAFMDGMTDKELYSELVFIDPVHLDRRCYMLEHPEYHVNHTDVDGLMPPKNEWYNYRPFEAEDVFAERLVQTRETGISFPKPVFEYSMITTATVKTNYENLKRRWEEVGGCRCYESETLWWGEDPE